MTRWAAAGCLALAALGAVEVLGVVGSPAAEAAPGVSRFAGTYVGWAPESWWHSHFTITISDAGRITGLNAIAGDKISGQVGADGSYSVSVTETVPQLVKPRGQSFSEGESEFRTIHYKSSGDMALDGSGNLVGTDDRGGGFIWVRE